MSFDNVIHILKGGSGSGNFGHSGRPGKIGGSAGGGSKVISNRIVPSVPNTVKGNLLEKIKNGLPAPSVGELKVGSWDPSAGYRQKPKSYVIVTMDGQVNSPSKEDLKVFADNFGIDLSDKT